MKYLFLTFIVIGAGVIGYYLGIESEKQEQAKNILMIHSFESKNQEQLENTLMNHLLCNLAVYQALQKGGPQLATDSLKVYIEADVKTYDFYKDQIPSFGDKNEHLQEFIKEARAIQDQQ